MAKRKRIYTDLSKITNPVYLVKCHRAFWEIAKTHEIESKIVRNAIDAIAEGSIVYFYFKTVNDKVMTSSEQDLTNPVNMIFMFRMRTLIKWRLKSYYTCNDFVFNSSIDLMENLLVEGEDDFYSIFESPEDMSQMIKQLQNNVSKLPNKQRKTIKYFYFQNYTLKEIAYILKVSYETVKSNKKDAMANLRESMKLDLVFNK